VQDILATNPGTPGKRPAARGFRVDAGIDAPGGTMRFQPGAEMETRPSARRRSAGERDAGPERRAAEAIDSACIDRLAGGDVGGLEALYDAHAAGLLALANRILRDPTEAEDLVHDLFVEIWQRISTYDPQRGSVRSWLLIRLRSRAIDRLRSRQARSSTTAQFAAASIAGKAMDHARTVDQRRAMLGLDEITELQREVLSLAYFQGLSLNEISEHCGIPLGTVKSRLSAAIAALRKNLRVGDEP
jgi:RNA polymerase sigma-70 factor (ECF subfamily)